MRTNESSPEPVHSQWDQQLFLAAHTQLFLPFFCHQQLRVVELKAITSENLPLAPWLPPQRRKSLMRPNPLLPLFHHTAREQLSWAGYRLLDSQLTLVAIAVSPAAATPHVPTHPALCFPRKDSPSAVWESHFVYNEVFSPKQSSPKAPKVTITQL